MTAPPPQAPRTRKHAKPSDVHRPSWSYFIKRVSGLLPAVGLAQVPCTAKPWLQAVLAVLGKTRAEYVRNQTGLGTGAHFSRGGLAEGPSQLGAAAAGRGACRAAGGGRASRRRVSVCQCRRPQSWVSVTRMEYNGSLGLRMATTVGLGRVAKASRPCVASVNAAKQRHSTEQRGERSHPV